MLLLTSWDSGFESRLTYGHLSLVSFVCCNVEVPATGRALIQRNLFVYMMNCNNNLY